MEMSKTPLNLYQLVLDRVEEHLSIQMENVLANIKGDTPPREFNAMNDILSYPPMAYLTKRPDYVSDLEVLDVDSQNWIMNFVNHVTMDWTMMVRTINGDDDYYDYFISSLEKTLTGITDSAVLANGYGERLESDRIKDPVSLTYYMLASSYRRIALKLGAANGRAASKPTN